MLRLGYWQWQRHLFKLGYISELQERLNLDIVDFDSLNIGSSTDWSKLPYRRVRLSGSYDFEHEFALRNRKYENSPGFHLITPLKLAGDKGTILIDRGFVPLDLEAPDNWKTFRNSSPTSFVALLKESVRTKMFAPNDPTPSMEKPVTAWLRVEIPKIQLQLPYPVLPIYGEIMGTTEPSKAEKLIINQKSGRDEMFIPGSGDVVQTPDMAPKGNYPIPSFDTVVPAGLHLGYVYEWSFMALITFLIGLGLQLRPPRSKA